MKLKFTWEDFPICANNPEKQREWAVKVANEKFEAWLEQQVVVQSNDFIECKEGASWTKKSESLYYPQTHRARRVCIEPLKAKVCEHEPALVRTQVDDFGGCQKAWLRHCRHCGVKLKAEWKVVEK